MFPYDAELLAAVANPPTSIPKVLETLTAIDTICVDVDGLKWFNWLYLEVTKAVDVRVNAGGFSDRAWLAELDVQFARLYLEAARLHLSGAKAAGCWRILFNCRDQRSVARVQFAMAGINAHINHDLAEAVVSTCQVRGTVPAHGCAQYADYTAVNTTLDQLIQTAIQTLHVRLPGDQLPPVSHLENTLAAWSTCAAREAAWKNAEILWHLRSEPLLTSACLDNLDGLTTVAGKALLVPVP